MLGFAWKFCLALDSPRASTKKNEIQNVESRIPHQVPIESRANSIHTCPQGYLYNLDPPGQYSLASSLLVMELWNFIKKWLCWDLKPLDFVEGISTWMSKVWEHCQHDCKWCPFGLSSTLTGSACIEISTRMSSLQVHRSSSTGKTLET